MAQRSARTTDESPNIEPNGWGEWANYVLTELKRLNEVMDELRKEITNVTIEVVQLKVKSSLWGAVAGAITVLLLLGITYLKGTLTEKDHRLIMPTYQQVSPYQTNKNGTGYYLVPVPQGTKPPDGAIQVPVAPGTPKTK